MKEQSIYTKEIAMTHGKPEADMLCRIEFKCSITDTLTVETVTLKFETDRALCFIDKSGYILVVGKESFIAFHPVKTELEIAKEQQIERLLPIINHVGGNAELNRQKLVALQDAGELAEITLPLEK